MRISPAIRGSTTAEFYNAEDERRYGRDALPDLGDEIRRLVERYAGGPADLVVDLGCGKGPFRDLAPGYLGIDISHYALRTFHGSGRCAQADIQALPVRSERAAVVISIAALEHVPAPEHCLEEVHRILRPGGVAYLAPAWFCRPWASRGLTVRPYRALSLREKLFRVVIPVLDQTVVRALWVVPARGMRELHRWWSGRPMSFRYRRLTPNLAEYLGPDSDASAAMDPHAVITYFLSRGYTILNAPTLRARLLVRHAAMIVRKPLQEAVTP